MNFVAFAALLSHWRRRPLQLLTLVMGIALATALWSGVQAINAEARASYARAASVLEQGNLREIVAKDGDGIASEVYGSLRRAGLNVSPVIEGNYRFGSTRIRLVGIEPLTMPRDTRNQTVASSLDLSGFFSASGQLIVSSATAERLRGSTDMSVKIDGKVPDGAASSTYRSPTGCSTSTGRSTAWWSRPIKGSPPKQSIRRD